MKVTFADNETGKEMKEALQEKITVTLTKDQARIIADDQIDRIINHEAWLKKYNDTKVENKLAFRKRLLNKIQQELVK